MAKTMHLPVTEPVIGYFDWHGSVDEYCEKYDDTPCIVERPDFQDARLIHSQRVPRKFFKMIQAASVLDHGWKMARKGTKKGKPPYPK